ncbi:mannosyl-oligosaccharide alpha-1,2-mannosidase [Blastomyces dermatitidis ER-3]|uniref:alpha-1,2-Mannosidase n=1 Tax=Ajellomyces dermatitidis (strain ER-3 / ATCC MYA-2586) TaxID=559297 RepID=A0ABP2ESN1_AJEDR|nr:mannosyl-oligosaccharide alpha-1,2-mannosidase [Blastomyces dermatitidis ER-3]EEQ86785.1 mannosyl-oligosaccharide alpha-1,2-mannosidase [Blastomyces dermatitidis ER-3]
MSGFPGGAAWTVPVWALVIVAALSLWIPPVRAMSGRQIRELREETEHMFYHGFENYMEHAFPEDELRPVSCRPLTRDRENPAHVDLNDVLGNYSLTLVDSLSTLAILSSSPPLSSGSNSDLESPRKAWGYFQDGVRDLVELYGDGSDGPAGTGSRGKGFDSDSKVQVFETVIRGLGGLLSAHLFAVGELPIRGYEPPEDEASFAKLWDKSGHTKGNPGIRWENGFVYNGQLLRLAMDLGTRILPAFYTPTGLPYPRVNLRRGVPFYTNSPFNAAAAPETAARISNDQGKQQGKTTQKPEVTETCSAGAGSLVLEFTVLSRLTGDGRFEEFAKRAFWAVWSRRSDIGLIGAGIDAESGKWVNSYTGIGAGIDSFFEYALKSHILLSEGDRPQFNLSSPFHKFDDFYAPLSEEEHSPDAFLNAWEESRASIKHHLYRGSGYQHPHYVQGDIITGATRAFWIDSLSAYFPGLLTLSGDVDGAIEAHLLHAAVWTRFSAFPERWNVATGNIENGLGWWGGRPEFIESTYYLYRATKDPWYLHVGEMALRDIKRRCWTRCGWAGLQDVRDGQLSDRMESFFLGETAKYLFLLFNPSHPLNDLDAPFVFSTEGHPLIIPKSPVKPTKKKIKLASPQNVDTQRDSGATCAVPAPLLPLGCSSIAGRPDIFHAASLARLHLMPARPEVDSPIVEYAIDHPRISMSDLISPSNYTYFPWTLPLEVIPPEATSAPMAVRPTLDLTFPPFANTIFSPGSLERVQDGVLVKSIGGLRLGMIQDVPLFTDGSSASTEGYRVQIINNFPLGKDEKVYISKEVTDALNSEDPNFTRVQDSTLLDVVLDLRSEVAPNENVLSTLTAATNSETIIGELDDFHASFDASTFDASNMKLAFASFFNQVTSLLRDDSDSTLSSFSSRKPTIRITIPATTSTGKGSTLLPDVEEALLSPSTVSKSNKGKKLVNRLPWSTIYVADELCDHRLPAVVPRTHHIIVIKRGGCSFSAKIKNIPSFRPTSDSLKLVIIVSYPQPGDRPPSSSSTSSSGTDPDTPTNSVVDTEEPYLIRPLLDEVQTVAGGIPRPNPLSVILVAGGDKTYNYFKHAVGVGLRRRYEIRSQGVPIGNLIVI